MKASPFYASRLLGGTHGMCFGFRNQDWPGEGWCSDENGIVMPEDLKFSAACCAQSWSFVCIYGLCVVQEQTFVGMLSGRRPADTIPSTGTIRSECPYVCSRPFTENGFAFCLVDQEGTLSSSHAERVCLMATSAGVQKAPMDARFLFDSWPACLAYRYARASPPVIFSRTNLSIICWPKHLV
jgi:hypothetical protein